MLGFAEFLESAEPAQKLQFIRALLENPRDLGQHLIFADWLDERGDELGGFVRTVVGRATAKNGLRELNKRLQSYRPLMRRAASDVHVGANQIFFRDVPEMYEYFPAGERVRFTRTGMRGEWRTVDVPAQTLIRIRRVPQPYFAATPDNRFDTSPDDWDFPWRGDRAELTPTLCDRLYVGVLLFVTALPWRLR